MKMPKYILTIGFNEYVVADNKGLATIMAVLEDAVPVRAHLHSKIEISLEWTEEGEEAMLAQSTTVSLVRIPPGVTWTRRTKAGTVEIIRPVALNAGDGVKRSGKAVKKLNGRQPLQLEFGR